MKLRNYILAFAMFALAACSKDEPLPPDPPRPEVASRTLLMYLAGRGNLVSAFDGNIRNAMQAINNNPLGNGRVLVFRQTGTDKAEISELRYSAQAGGAVQEVLKSYEGWLQSTDPATMTRILNDMITLAPSKHYGLVMGSHATGWVPSKYTYLSAPLDGGIAAAPAGDAYWQKTGEAETRGFGYDNGTVMDISSLAAGIEGTGKEFDYLIFDACFMSSIEALYELRNAADRIIASPSEVMLYGFPYDRALPYLFLNNGEQIDLKGVCQQFYDFYATTTVTRQSGCIALTECSQLEALAQVVRRINITGQKSYNKESLQIYEGLSPHLFYDLGDFVRAVCSTSELRKDFDDQFDRAFPQEYRHHTPEFFTDYGKQMIPIQSYSGVTVSEPSVKYTADNKQTAWYKATHE